MKGLQDYLEEMKEKEFDIAAVAEEIYMAANYIDHEDYEQYVDEILAEIKERIKELGKQQEEAMRD